MTRIRQLRKKYQEMMYAIKGILYKEEFEMVADKLADMLTVLELNATMKGYDNDERE